MGSQLIRPRFLFPSSVPGSGSAAYKVLSSVGGSATPLTTYADAKIVSSDPNPALMDDSGMRDVWVADGTYRFVGSDNNGNALWTVDNMSQAGLGQTPTEWILIPGSPVFLGPTSFFMANVGGLLNVAPYFLAIGTRVKTINSGGTIYGTILSIFNNTIVIRTDAGVLDVGLSAVYYGLVAGANDSAAKGTLISATQSGNTTLGAFARTVVSMSASTIIADALSEISAGIWTVKAAGTYRVSGVVAINEFAGTAAVANGAFEVDVRQNTLVGEHYHAFNWPFANNTAATFLVPFNTLLTCAVNDQIDMAVAAPAFTGTAMTASVRSFNAQRLT